MKMNTSTLIIIVTAFVVAGGAYYYIQQNTVDASLTPSVADSNAQIEFQTLISQLQPVELDTKVLQDSRFLSLQDLTERVVMEQKGRPDPFAPIAGVSAP
jgi:hypothetical protein